MTELEVRAVGRYFFEDMRMFRCAFFLICCALPTLVAAQATTGSANTEIANFNRALYDATLRMDNAATVALWDERGVSLLPMTKPIIGKKAVADFMNAVTAQIAGGRMEKFDLECFDIEVTGAWASEWCTEHQIVNLPDNKRFEGWGKMLFVLHRGTEGTWRITREMWNQATP